MARRARRCLRRGRVPAAPAGNADAPRVVRDTREPCRELWAQPVLTADGATHTRGLRSAAGKSNWNARSEIAPVRCHAQRLRADHADTPPALRWRYVRRPA